MKMNVIEGLKFRYLFISDQAFLTRFCSIKKLLQIKQIGFTIRNTVKTIILYNKKAPDWMLLIFKYKKYRNLWRKNNCYFSVNAKISLAAIQ
ncbi:hypothetical protein EG344_21955 [Chryseobacterium sp. G0162]|nr:hypothetical protein EG344_21955 [Chryseobacterium sp. G0162]